MKDRKKQSGGTARQSGINQEDVIEKAFPIDASKVMLVDPKSKKAHARSHDDRQRRQACRAPPSKAARPFKEF